MNFGDAGRWAGFVEESAVEEGASLLASESEIAVCPADGEIGRREAEPGNGKDDGESQEDPTPARISNMETATHTRLTARHGGTDESGEDVAHVVAFL